MAKLYGEIAKNALLTLDKSFSRALGQPLDGSEVYYSLEAAQTYAATPAAYIGQKIVVIEDNKITHYSVEDAAGTLKELGTKPVGDGKSITVDTNGIIGIIGADSADSLTIPRIKEDKSGIEWVPISAVVDGDGNDNTTYEITALKNLDNETYGIKVKTLFNGTSVEGGEFEIGFDVYTKSEIDTKFEEVDTKIGISSKPESSEGANDAVAATGIYKLIEDEAARAIAAEAVLDGRIAAIDFVDDIELTNAIKDFATTTYVDGEIDKLEEAIGELNHFTAEVVTDKALMTEVGVLYLYKIDSAIGSDVYEEYIVIDGVATLIGDTTTDLRNYYNKTEVDNAISTAVSTAIAIETSAREDLAEKVTALENIDNVTQVELDAYKQTVTDALIEKADTATTLAGYGITDAYKKSETYNQTEIAALLESIQTSSSESITSIQSQLDTYKESNNNRINVVETKLATIEENSEKNIIEAIKVNGVALDVSTEDRSVNVVITPETLNVYTKTESDAKVKVANDAAATAQAKAEEGVANAATAQAKADSAYTLAESNQGNISTLTNTVDSHTTSIDDHTGRIAILENFKTSHEAKYTTLNEIVSGHTADISKKALASDLNDAVTRINANETAISTINNTTIPSINVEINKKANAADVYVKDDVYTKDEIGNIVGDLKRDDKTLVELINEAHYDDTEVKANIASNTAAIAILNGDDQTEGSVDYKVAQEVAKILNDNNDSDIDTLNEIAAWITNDTTGAAKMNSDIAANTAAIAILNGDENTTGSVLSIIKDNAPVIATANIAGIVKSSSAENNISVSEDGTMSVNTINVNKLVQTDGDTLVLYGGAAV